MECEVCGKTIFTAYRVKIEGADVRVCQDCAKFGSAEELKVATEKRKFVPTVKVGETKPLDIPEFAEDYGKIIMSAREAMGLSREKLGEKISVKASVIARLESGKMKPDMKLAKRLEQTLGVNLLEEPQEEDVKVSKKTRGELTLGDIIKIKNKEVKEE